ncbi:hypothetical protein ASZ90_008345 [hydrocarbon metagenome]|uniref:Glycosyltransferase RgtA/B/C/D-like domain-containing protein n=1 Tax=hydrocarbon metagenome TaxID=938273 RepID=A0A0W8FLQ8_9ZZZZ
MNFKLNSTENKSIILIILALTILTLVVYWPVQNYEFINYDDEVYVTDNYRIQQGLTLKNITNTFSDFHTSNWHPLTMISHMLDWQLFGFRAGGHHWTNVIIHIFNTILLFLLFNKLTGAVWKSALIAALFAIHPINVQSVAWISERKNVLSTFFWIVTILFYVRYVKQPDWKKYLPIFFCFALGLMAKPMLVTLPFVLLLLDYWPLNRTQIKLPNRNEDKVKGEMFPLDKNRKISFLILEKVPLFILSVISVFFTIYGARYVRTITSLEYLPFSLRIPNSINSYVLYIKKLFWPNDLAVFYPISHIPVWQCLVAALFLLGITFFVCRYFRKHPYLPVGWFWYLGTLVPVIGIVQVGTQAMADRYAYVPFIGLFVIIAWGAENLSFKNNIFKKTIIFMAVFIIIALTITAYNQVKVWRDTVTLFEDTLKKTKNNYVAYDVLGFDAARKNENERALMNYYMAQKSNPKFYPAYNNAGIVLIKMGRRNEAFKNFEMTLKVNKFSAPAYYNIGLLYLKDNNLDKSMMLFKKAIEIQPDYIEAYNNLGVVYIKKGMIRESISNFQKSLEINPSYREAQHNLQIANAMQKEKKQHGHTIK